MSQNQTVIVQSAASKILESGDEIVWDSNAPTGRYILKANGGVYKCMESDYETGTCLTWLLQQGVTSTEIRQNIFEKEHEWKAKCQYDFIMSGFLTIAIMVGICVFASIVGDSK
jgi:hypothetical protein